MTYIRSHTSTLLLAHVHQPPPSTGVLCSAEVVEWETGLRGVERARGGWAEGPNAADIQTTKPPPPSTPLTPILCFSSTQLRLCPTRLPRGTRPLIPPTPFAQPPLGTAELHVVSQPERCVENYEETRLCFLHSPLAAPELVQVVQNFGEDFTGG